MSEYKWQGYVSACIREYPLKRAQAEKGNLNLKGQEAREYEAVRKALEVTEGLKDGKERMELIRLAFWNPRMTMTAVAMRCYVSYGTALRRKGEFIRLVASCMGLLD